MGAVVNAAFLESIENSIRFGFQGQPALGRLGLVRCCCLPASLGVGALSVLVSVSEGEQRQADQHFKSGDLFAYLIFACFSIYSE
jgi:hypothetical protein